MYRLFIRPVLFAIDPEKVHHLVFSLLKWSCRIPFVGGLIKNQFSVNDPSLGVNKMGLHFPNPVGLAAGFDKDARLFKELSYLGFGFIEIGTVTPKPQDGNDKPRLFRLPFYKALINRMGFNNDGVDNAVLRLRKKHQVLIGGNIGKNKITPNENAIDDYLYCFNALHDVVDYFVVNVSSPNTPGLRALQEKEPLQNLLTAIQEVNNKKEKPKPVLIKIAPDLSSQQIDEIIEIVHTTGLAGIVATNTTISREGISDMEQHSGEQGGLSGLPVKDRSTAVIKRIREKAGDEIIIIGVGGIFTAEDALEKLNAGADLVQVYTGFIYEGPSMVKRICKTLALSLSTKKQTVVNY
ncbi:MAG: quinone-dependent dihydroorotate dehydrogenase [Bacteroidota bacterium]